ncbi:DegT/DnrJ/EryC1/StrS family aminotransferase [Flavobacteriales bacterium]|nr:DegT/DnrJ/EryC1/StrS family aminotransferase [Flavobacteriales bacterium]
MKNKPIYVTQPSLPPLKEYTKLLEEIWESGILTHNGPKVIQLENELKNKLGTSHLSVVSNGTIALQIAIRALELKGEIITSAFSWIATVSAIKYEGCTPVFCDADPDSFNIDVDKIENLITEKTVAIMPVHVFGTPCDVYTIEKIAKKHNLKVIYDAAHAIGSSVNGESALNFGDISATSLHGTKLLNTAEGGACVTKDANLDLIMKRIRFFGHNEEKEVVMDGFNGKMTEVHAALGLANLKYYDHVLEDRRGKYQMYLDLLAPSRKYQFQSLAFGETNYSYFPVVFKSEEEMLKVIARLNKENIYPRRYFYPSLNTYTKIVDYSDCPVSEDISSRILCLPLYKKLEIEDISRICTILNKI